MSYAYGPKGAPAVGKGLGGLPRRRAASGIKNLYPLDRSKPYIFPVETMGFEVNSTSFPIPTKTVVCSGAKTAIAVKPNSPITAGEFFMVNDTNTGESFSYFSNAGDGQYISGSHVVMDVFEDILVIAWGTTAAVNTKKFLSAFNYKTGEVIWELDFTATSQYTAGAVTAVKIHDGEVFVGIKTFANDDNCYIYRCDLLNGSQTGFGRRFSDTAHDPYIYAIRIDESAPESKKLLIVMLSEDGNNEFVIVPATMGLDFLGYIEYNAFTSQAFSVSQAYNLPITVNYYGEKGEIWFSNYDDIGSNNKIIYYDVSGTANGARASFEANIPSSNFPTTTNVIYDYDSQRYYVFILSIGANGVGRVYLTEFENRNPVTSVINSYSYTINRIHEKMVGDSLFKETVNNQTIIRACLNSIRSCPLDQLHNLLGEPDIEGVLFVNSNISTEATAIGSSSSFFSPELSPVSPALFDFKPMYKTPSGRLIPQAEPYYVDLT